MRGKLLPLSLSATMNAAAPEGTPPRRIGDELKNSLPAVPRRGLEAVVLRREYDFQGSGVNRWSGNFAGNILPGGDGNGNSIDSIRMHNDIVLRFFLCCGFAMHPRLASFYNSPWINSHWFTEVMFIGRTRYEKLMGHWDWVYQILSRLRLLLR